MNHLGDRAEVMSPDGRLAQLLGCSGVGHFGYLRLCLEQFEKRSPEITPVGRGLADEGFDDSEDLLGGEPE